MSNTYTLKRLHLVECIIFEQSSLKNNFKNKCNIKAANSLKVLPAPKTFT